MMFVFRVDQGRMLTFKMECMIEDIRKLKEVIERNHAIPARSIVLLVSGGQLLGDDSRACNYATGTDTNPIYMFCNNIGQSSQPLPAPIKETEVDLEGMVKKGLELPVAYSTVAARAQLAQKIYEMGQEELRRCETLIHEQHLQQQGWAAVVANMEDTIKEFQDRSEYFNRYYEEQLRLHEEQLEILQNFDKSLQQLADIPILSSLIENAESRPYGMFDEVFNRSVTSNSEASRTASNTSQSQMGSGEGSASKTASDTAAGVKPTDGTTIEAASSSECPETDAVESGPNAMVAVDELNLTEKERKGISLLDWISAMDGQLTLRRMAEECRINIEKFNRERLTLFNESIDTAVKKSQCLELKVVKGLEERLCGLDQLLAKAKKILQEQNELAKGIQNNHARANTIGDTSVLPDLCEMHRNHLNLMKKNHTELLEYRRRCTVAKDQLGVNLTMRLSYIMNVETKVHDLDSSIQLYHTSLQRLQKHLSIIEQIHMVPCMYVSAVTEVVRRRMFSRAFLKWASELACRMMAIHNEEVMRRQEFASQFDGHFLSTLFPGMNDMPPSYANQAPSVFDSSLPALDKKDLEELSRFLPELTEKIPLPNITSVIDFFQTRSVEQQQLLQQNRSSSAEKDDISASARSKDNATASSSENTGPSNVPGEPEAKENDKIIGAESETDTEEYEKIQNQSPVGGRSRQEEPEVVPVMTCSVATSTEPVETVCAETLTEDNLGTTRLEVERLKALLHSVYQLSQDSIILLRGQLTRVRGEVESNRTQFQSELSAINRAWNDIQQLAQNRERETIQQLTVDHELEMNDLRKSILLKDDEIQSLRSDNSTMKASQIETVSSYEQEKKELSEQITQMQQVISRLECQLANAEVDRKTALKEAIDQLEHKHRTEIETFRSRFKLMASSMDRSPSDTSLEKIEKPDMIDIGTHEQLMAQVREELQREKQQAVRAAIEEERQRLETNAIGGGAVGSAGNRLHRSYGAGGSPSGGSQDVYKRILEEKERQNEELREQNNQLLRTVIRMQETMQSLTDPELSPLNEQCSREHVEAIEASNQQMTERLVQLQSHVKQLEQDYHNLKLSFKDDLRKEMAQLISCTDGDTVTFMWNPTYAQYTIIQVAEYIYFVHESSYPTLGILPPLKGEVPPVLFGFGTIISKEFCHARKDDNRYGVSRGTQFYRVRLKPANVSKKSKSRSSSYRGASDSGESSIMQQSTSASVTIEVQPSGTSGRLIDSFAQTEQPTESATTVSTSATTMLIGTPTGDGSKSPTTASRDMIDSGVAEQQRSGYRERNISITDDDDVVVGIGSTGSIDRIRYQSVCEEEDPAGDDDTDGELPETTGGSSATVHRSCYTSATDTSTIVAIRCSPVPSVGSNPPEGSSGDIDGGEHGEVSTASSAAIALSGTNNPQPSQMLLSVGGGGGPGFSSIADDISDSADSEYRSLEANDLEDSDSGAAPLPAAHGTSSTFSIGHYALPHEEGH
ncbi:RB1-inducible coiled-coil protein 1 [Anopheles nili]|uniref:RB1-inducible coiled-coil protein 1 n=1 Tax=Anopheles nili TaxID=185578 RepID=UPI00237B1BF7|nr:RB1-inducible coiled-coil protein 1 [Anopheles nili]